MDVSTLQRLERQYSARDHQREAAAGVRWSGRVAGLLRHDKDQLATRLQQIGYHYDPMSNQFKAHG